MCVLTVLDEPRFTLRTLDADRIELPHDRFNPRDLFVITRDEQTIGLLVGVNRRGSRRFVRQIFDLRLIEFRDQRS